MKLITLQLYNLEKILFKKLVKIFWNIILIKNLRTSLIIKYSLLYKIIFLISLKMKKWKIFNKKKKERLYKIIFNLIN